MLRITGYSDKYSVHPGEKVKFYINSESNENYEVQIVRLIHGDTNPEGPGYKEEELGASCNGNHEGRNQRIHGGSYVIICKKDFKDYRIGICSGVRGKPVKILEDSFSSEEACEHAIFLKRIFDLLEKYS